MSAPFAPRHMNMGVVKRINRMGFMLNRTLCHAAGTGRICTVRFLLDRGVSVDSADAVIGQTALQAAVTGHHTAITQMLLQRCQNVLSAMPVICGHGDLELLRSLWNRQEVQGAIEPTISEDDESEVLPFDYTTMSSTLLRQPYGDPVNNSQLLFRAIMVQALHAAALHGHVHILQFLLNEGGQAVHRTRINGFGAIDAAAEGGHVPALDFLLTHFQDAVQHDVKRSARNVLSSALITAANANRLAVCQYLVEKRRVDPNGGTTADLNPLCAAAARDAVPIVEFLLSVGASVERTYCNAMAIALTFQHAAALKVLVDSELRSNGRAFESIAPSLWLRSAWDQATECVQLLLDIHARLAGSEHLFHYLPGPVVFELMLDLATKYRQSRMVDCLQAHASKYGINRMTPGQLDDALVDAITSGRVELTTVLLQHRMHLPRHLVLPLRNAELPRSEEVLRIAESLGLASAEDVDACTESHSDLEFYRAPGDDQARFHPPVVRAGGATDASSLEARVCALHIDASNELGDGGSFVTQASSAGEASSFLQVGVMASTPFEFSSNADPSLSLNPFGNASSFMTAAISAGSHGATSAPVSVVNAFPPSVVQTSAIDTMPNHGLFTFAFGSGPLFAP